MEVLSSSGRELSNLSSGSRLMTGYSQEASSLYTSATYEESYATNGQSIHDGENLADETPVTTTVNDPYLTRTDSPDTDLLSVGLQRPDITILCEVCNVYIDMRALMDHRTYHRSLDVMRYHGNNRPASVEALLKRRKTLLKRLKSQTPRKGPPDPTEIQKLNEAFEFLKADLEDTYDEFRKAREHIDIDVHGLALNCSTACAPAVGICSTQNSRWKNVMEDTRVYQDCFGNDTNKCFFGIYDGHNGHFASEMAAKELHQAILTEMVKFDPRTKCTHGLNTLEGIDGDTCGVRPSTSDTERGMMYSESTAMIQEIIENCKERLDEMEREEMARSEASAKPHKNRDVFAERMSRAMKRAHYITDLLLSWGKEERSRVRWSGCSTLTCVIQNKISDPEPEQEDKEPSRNNDNKIVFGMEDSPDQPDNMDREGKNMLKPPSTHFHEGNKGATEEQKKFDPPKEMGVIHLAHAGNVQAVLVRGNKAYRLTRDHTPRNAKEKARVLKYGGTVSDSNRDLRVNGILATTRGLGNHGDPCLKKCVISEPHTTTVPIDQYAQLLVMASNGIWEVFSPSEVASLMVETFPSNHIPPPSRLSTSINLLLAEINSQQHARAYQEWNVSTAGKRRPLYSAISEQTSEATSKESRDSKLRTGKVRIMTGRTGSADSTHSSQSQSRVKLRSEVSSQRQPVLETTTAGQHLAEHRLPSIMVDRTSAEHDQGQGQGDAKPGDKMGRESLNKKMLHPQADLQTEVGSRAGDISEEDSGNEADVDTTTDILSLYSEGRNSNSREEVMRECAKLLSERLVQAALLAGARDNITAMVILLPGCGL